MPLLLPHLLMPFHQSNVRCSVRTIANLL